MSLHRTFHRAIALGIPVIAALLLWGLLVSPVLHAFNNLDRDIEARRFLLGKYAGVLTRVGYSEEKARDVVSKLDRSELLETAPDAVIAANLQSRIAELARQSSLQTHSMQVLPARNDSKIKWIGVGVTLTGAAENIANMFALIEGAKPYLFIESLALSAQAASLSGSETPATLVADFEVYGVVLEPIPQ